MNVIRWPMPQTLVICKYFYVLIVRCRRCEQCRGTVAVDLGFSRSRKKGRKLKIIILWKTTTWNDKIF